MSSLVRRSPAARTLSRLCTLVLAVAACASAIDLGHAGIEAIASSIASSIEQVANHPQRRASIAPVARVAETPRQTQNGERGGDAQPECSSWEDRAETDDVDARTCLTVDAPVLAEGPEKLLAEDSVHLRVEDRRSCRPPNLGA